jgi:hypothetical protein
MASCVQDATDRLDAADQAELNGIAGHPGRVRRQAVEVRGGLARVGQGRPDQPGIGADVSGEDVRGARHAAQLPAVLTTR